MCREGGRGEGGGDTDKIATCRWGEVTDYSFI